MKSVAMGWGAVAGWAFTALAFALAFAGLSSAVPSVNITSPTESAVMSSATVSINLTVGEFTLDMAAAGSAPAAGVGHYHILLDGTLAKMGGTPTTFLAAVSAGPHTIVVELVGNDHAPIGTNDTVNISVAAGAPSLRLLSPADGALVPLNWTAFSIAVTNFTLDPAAINNTPVAGRGHYHIFVDTHYEGLSANPTHFVANLAAGNHTLRISLYNNDHTPITPWVFDEVRLQVVGARAAIAILLPPEGAIVWGPALTLRVAVANFTLDAAAVGSSPVAGRGHWHANVDGVYADFSATDSLQLKTLVPGNHVITVGLYNNDHTQLALPASDSVTVHVAALPFANLTAPANNSEVTGSSVTLSIRTTNITLNRAAIGGTSVAGHGHYHVSVDGTYIDAGAEATFVLGNLTLGEHVVTVSLHNNDHSPIPGVGSAEVHITVKAPPAPGFLPAFEAAGTLLAGAAAAACAIGVRAVRGRKGAK
jgi:hypothetical protein